MSVLIKAALDGAFELKSINTVDVFGETRKEQVDQIVARIYTAAEALGPTFTDDQVSEMFGQEKAGATS